MKTILVLSNHPDFAEAIRAGLDAEHYRVVHRLTVDEAEPLLAHGLAAACILDVDLMDVEGVWAIERLRRLDAKSPVIVYTAASQSEWEEEAFLHGVTHVLTKPVRARLLNNLAGAPRTDAASSVPPRPRRRRRKIHFPAPPEFPATPFRQCRRRRSTCCAIFRPSSPTR